MLEVKTPVSYPCLSLYHCAIHLKVLHKLSQPTMYPSFRRLLLGDGDGTINIYNQHVVMGKHGTEFRIPSVQNPELPKGRLALCPLAAFQFIQLHFLPNLLKRKLTCVICDESDAFTRD